MVFGTDTPFSSDMEDWSTNLSSTIVCSILASCAFIGFLTIYFRGRLAKSQKLVVHEPGFQTNKPSSKPLTETLILVVYIALWIYMASSLWLEGDMTGIFQSLDAPKIILALSNIVLTYLIVWMFISFSRLFYTLILFSIVAVPSAAALAFLIASQSLISAVVCGCWFLVIIVLYGLLFEYVGDIYIVFEESTSAILRNFIPISKMLLIATTMFAGKMLIIYLFITSPSGFNLSNIIFAIMIFNWSWTIYQYLCKASMSSAVYLSLENKNDKSIFRKTLSASISSFGAICSAAFIPSLLRTLREIFRQAYNAADSSKPEGIFLWLTISIPKAALYMILIFLDMLIFLFDFFNESFIPYLGIYGGGYNTSTAKKAVMVLSTSKTYLFLNLPQVKSILSMGATGLFATIFWVANRWLILPILKIDPFTISTVLKAANYYLFEALWQTSASPVPAELQGAKLTLAILAFCVIVFYSFMQCVDSAFAAKVCYDYDQERREQKLQHESQP